MLRSKTQPYAGKAEVFNTAEKLLAEKGETTTLEVKMNLRAQGYIAFQRDISYFMELVAEEAGWQFTCNGRNRTYYAAKKTAWLAELLLVCEN